MPDTNLIVIGTSYIWLKFTLVFLGELNAISLLLLAYSGSRALASATFAIKWYCPDDEALPVP